jgi:K+-transporting ATPase KdpF subunit
MSTLEVVSLALAGALGVYLVVALLKPEMFQ